MSFRWASDDDDDDDDGMTQYGGITRYDADILQRFHSILCAYNDKIEIKKRPNRNISRLKI